MRHRKTYLYINLQQNRVSRSVKTCAQIFLQKIASCIHLHQPIVFFKNQLLKTCIIIKRTCSLSFSKIGFVDQSKLCAQICLQKYRKLHKFATTNSNF